MPVAHSQESSPNHSLITYRQYSTLLSEAPQCFRTGCGVNATLTTASSPCSVESPCHGLWNIIQDQFQRDWCSSSPGDIACRIRGWPILNSTSICEMVPNEWIFYVIGQCCTFDDQPFEMAKWIGTLCNGRWKEPFEIYGGMAQEDWQEWIVPWNWTVRPENATSGILKTSDCPKPSQELGLFAAENVFLLFLGAIIPYLKYRRECSRSGQRTGPRHTGIMVRITRYWDRRTQGKYGELATIQWIAVGIIIAGINLGFDFLIALLINRTAGYSHVPVVELAVLHGTRPRLGWALCSLAIINHQIFANAAASFGLCEMILQCFGSKYFGVTANKGTQRGFYHLHRLHPFWHGRAAYRMYIGALLWLLGCFAIILSWLLFVTLLGHFLIYCNKLKKWEEAQVAKIRARLRPTDKPHQARYANLAARRRSISTPVLNLIPTTVLVYSSKFKEWMERKLWGSDSPTINPHYATLTQTPRPADTLRKVREKSVYLVLLVGLCSYSAQWIFWDGFVKTAGPR